jgi:hypothetical protein
LNTYQIGVLTGIIIVFVCIIVYIYKFTHDWVKVNKRFILEEIQDEHLLKGFMNYSKVEICDHCGLVRTSYKSMGNWTYTELGYLIDYKKILRKYKRYVHYKELEEKEIERRKKLKLRETDIHPLELFKESFFSVMGINQIDGVEYNMNPKYDKKNKHYRIINKGDKENE